MGADRVADRRRHRCDPAARHPRRSAPDDPARATGRHRDCVAAASAGAEPTVASDDHDKTTRDRDERPRPVRRLRVAPAAPAQPVAEPADATAPVATQQTLALDVAPAVAAKRTARRSTKHNDTIRAEALQRVAAGETLRDVADRLGVSKDAVWRWTRDARMAATVAVG
ncbi:helix-turn-helix domain-containing protein [Rhodococcus zopfii]|uniref:Helix-turn-helix domain-containing protein n=1 Tax=Rhodococcus zopfii TaxID=43772 RepID=A0ABU3WJN9_9NOCA|nr:helix-turn-helix domain-containing protein [Rhodococcus zopfii]